MAPTASPMCYLLDDADHVVDAVFPRKGTLAQAIRGAVAKHLLHEQLTGASRPSCCTDDLCTGMMAQVGQVMMSVWRSWHNAHGQRDEPYDGPEARKHLLADPCFTVLMSPSVKTDKLLQLDVHKLLDIAAQKDAAGCGTRVQALSAALARSQASGGAAAAAPAGDVSSAAASSAAAAALSEASHPSGVSTAAGSSSSKPKALYSTSTLSKLKAGVELVWPGSDVDSKLRRVAAAALLGSHSCTQTKIALGVAIKQAAVREGGEVQKGGLLRRVLEGDPHFDLSAKGGANVALNLEQMFSTMEKLVAAAAAQHPPAATGTAAVAVKALANALAPAKASAAASAADVSMRTPSPATPAAANPVQRAGTAPAPAGPTAGSSSAAAGRSSVQEPLPGLAAVWPGHGPEARLYRITAAALLSAPSNTLTTIHLGAALKAGAPSLWGATVTTWRKPSLKQLITGDSHLMYHAAGTASPAGTEAAVSLDTAQLRASLQSKAGHEGAVELQQLLSLAQYQSSKAKGSGNDSADAGSSRQQAEQQQQQQQVYEEEPEPVINQAVIKLEELEQQAGAARVQVVSKPGPQLEAAVAHLRSCAQVGLGVELSGSGEVMLVQLMATAGSGSSSRLPPTIYVIDLVDAGRKTAKLMTARLKPLMQDSRVTKVVHDAARACRALADQHSIALAGAFDTQVAYGLAAVAAVGGKGALQAGRIALPKLLGMYGYKSSSSRLQQPWTAKQHGLWHLPADLQQQASEGVRHLLPLAFRLKDELRGVGEQMAGLASGSRADVAVVADENWQDEGPAGVVAGGSWVLQLLEWAVLQKCAG